ncbi:MAG: AI-2E family transporter, partial [Candidatus Nanohaloarchaea archaeon]
QAGQFERVLRPYIDVSQVVSDPESILSQPNTFEVIRQTMDEAGKYLGFIGNAALHLFVMILIAFYLLRDDRRLAGWFRRRFADTEGVLEEYARRVDRDFSNIFFGNLLNAVLTGIIGAISYGVLDLISPAGVGIPYPTLLGLLTGIASLVPVVGIKLVYVPLAGYLGYQVLSQTTLLWFPI